MAVAPVMLTPTHHKVLALLARLRFATRVHLHYWSSLKELSSITRATNELLKQDLIEMITELRPAVYRLSRAGCRIMSINYTARRFSLPVIQHYCHRNTAEIQLQTDFPHARFRARTVALKQGLFPSHAEHLLTLGNDHGIALALIDDYAMRSQRIEQSWRRLHAPDARFYRPTPDSVSLKWADIASHLFVFCSDATVAARHEAFIAFSNLPARLYPLKPIWRTI